MRFGNNTTPPRFLSRKDQRRMIGMIVLLGMVFLAIKATAQPSFWWWMFPDERPVAKADQDEQKRQEIDHSVPDERDLRPDEVVVGRGSAPGHQADGRTGGQPGDAATAGSGADASGDTSSQDSLSSIRSEDGESAISGTSDSGTSDSGTSDSGIIADRAVDENGGAGTAEPESDGLSSPQSVDVTATGDDTNDASAGATDRANPSVSTEGVATEDGPDGTGSIPAIEWLGPPDLNTASLPRDIFDATLDRRIGIRRSEVATYYYILAKARDIAPAVLGEAVQPAADYLSMMTDPAQFRGRVIRLKGDATRIEPFSAARNPMGVEQLYDVWMFTRESGDSPIHVQVSSIPDGIPTGRELPTPIPVEITGYFFRIEGYESVGGVHTAPLLLAGKLEWNRPTASPAGQEDVSGYIWGFAGIIAGGVALILWRFRASDRRVAKSSLEKYMHGPERAEGLEQFDTVDPAEEFARMANELEKSSPES